MPAFKTTDGYELCLIGNVWTDGDLAFEDQNGWPVDRIGSPLVGKLDDLRVCRTEVGRAPAHEQAKQLKRRPDQRHQRPQPPAPPGDQPQGQRHEAQFVAQPSEGALHAALPCPTSHK